MMRITTAKGILAYAAHDCCDLTPYSSDHYNHHAKTIILMHALSNHRQLKVYSTHNDVWPAGAVSFFGFVRGCFLFLLVFVSFVCFFVLFAIVFLCRSLFSFSGFVFLSLHR